MRLMSIQYSSSYSLSANKMLELATSLERGLKRVGANDLRKNTFLDKRKQPRLNTAATRLPVQIIRYRRQTSRISQVRKNRK